MYFSIREKKILSLLLDYPNGITSEELQDILQVSKRTVYREISGIESHRIFRLSSLVAKAIELWEKL